MPCGTLYRVRKTSVYLTDEDAEGLRRAAAIVGKPQAELIRLGVRRVIAESDARSRVFHSLGKGRSNGRPFVPWESGPVYRKAMGQE
jgi:hypothetical protein